MTTPRTRSLVSLAAVLTVSLMLGACVSAPSRLAPEGSTLSDDAPVVIRFDNDARDYVHVYLVGEQREWLLGRVEPGAHATLRLPDAALAEDAGPMRLAVLGGERVTFRVAGEAHAATTIAQLVASILTQRWTFSQSLSNGQLISLPVGRARASRVSRGQTP